MKSTKSFMPYQVVHIDIPFSGIFKSQRRALGIPDTTPREPILQKVRFFVTFQIN